MNLYNFFKWMVKDINIWKTTYTLHNISLWWFIIILLRIALKNIDLSHVFYNYTKFLVVHKAQVQLSMHDTIISFIMSLF
jgi:hypothetical protein